MYDVVIIGSGPAGLSAGINVRARNKTALIISNDPHGGHLSKAPHMENYLGMPGMTGHEMMDQFLDHARHDGVEFRFGRVISVLPFGDTFMVSIGAEYVEAKTVVLAVGSVPPAQFEGEAQYLGRGVSYCATCDGMLYKGKPVIVYGDGEDSVSDARFLAELGCPVTFVSRKPVEGLPEEVTTLTARKFEVMGDGQKATGLIADGVELPASGVFILRQAIAPSSLIQGLATNGASIVVNRRMETNIPGLYAAGDCTGAPAQVAKAVGEGQVAGLAACARIDQRERS